MVRLKPDGASAVDEEHPRGQAPPVPASARAERGRADEPRRVPSHGFRFRNRLTLSLKSAAPSRVPFRGE